MDTMKDIIFSTEILTEFELDSTQNTKVRAIIVTPKESENLLKKEIMGKTSKDYVLESVVDYEKTEIVSSDPLINAIKPFIKDEDYVVCLYADTPFVTSQMVADSLEYAVSKKVDFCKLPRGAIFKASAVKTNKIEVSCEASFLNSQDFYYIFNLTTLATAREKMRRKILENLSKTVEFDAINSCYIDSTVKIKPNTHIGANCVLKGYSQIGENCEIGANSIIKNCKIGENCEIECSCLANIDIKSGTKLPPFTNKEKK